MNDDLKTEIESILKMDNSDLQRNSAHKIAVYLMTLPPPAPEYMSLLELFVDKLVDILPSSSVPQLLAVKFGIQRRRRAVVMFADTQVYILPSSIILSTEGKAQQQREASTLNLQNTDTRRKFVPRQALTDGLMYKTVNISLMMPNLVNKAIMNVESSSVPLVFSRPKLTVSKILANPSLLRTYE